MSPSLGSERGSVQNPIIRYATEIGWTFVPRDEAEERRCGQAGFFFYDIGLADGGLHGSARL